MRPVLLLTVYCVLSMLAALAGGWVPLLVRLTHRRMQIAISFVSGMMLGIGLLHLLPHGFEALGSIEATVTWVLAGFLFVFFLERFFHFHHHEAEPTGEAAEPAHHHHQRDHGHDHDHGAMLRLPWIGAAIGLTLHGLVDGVAVAAAVMAEEGNLAVAWAGLGTFLAIALHKPLDALTIGTLLAAAGRSTSLRHWFNAAYALVTPLGIVVFYVFSSRVELVHDGLGQILAFAAGAFVCIASSDLLPELQFHRHDRVGLSAALMAGIALAWGTVRLEGDHHHSASSIPVHEHDHRAHE